MEVIKIETELVTVKSKTTKEILIPSDGYYGNISYCGDGECVYMYKTRLMRDNDIYIQGVYFDDYSYKSFQFAVSIQELLNDSNESTVENNYKDEYICIIISDFKNYLTVLNSGEDFEISDYFNLNYIDFLEKYEAFKNDMDSIFYNFIPSTVYDIKVDFINEQEKQGNIKKVKNNDKETWKVKERNKFVGDYDWLGIWNYYENKSNYSKDTNELFREFKSYFSTYMENSIETSYILQMTKFIQKDFTIPINYKDLVSMYAIIKHKINERLE